MALSHSQFFGLGRKTKLTLVLDWLGQGRKEYRRSLLISHCFIQLGCFYQDITEQKNKIHPLKGCGKFELFAPFILTDGGGAKNLIATTVFLLVRALAEEVCLETIFSDVSRGLASTAVSFFVCAPCLGV